MVDIDHTQSSAVATTAILSTGRAISVPLFIETGNRIRVNTIDVEYVDRIIS